MGGRPLERLCHRVLSWIRCFLLLLLCPMIRGLGTLVRGRRSRHCGRGCSSGGLNRRGLLRGLRLGLRWTLGRRLCVVPRVVSLDVDV
jgi:hypothetical protein